MSGFTLNEALAVACSDLGFFSAAIMVPLVKRHKNYAAMISPEGGDAGGGRGEQVGCQSSFG